MNQIIILTSLILKEYLNKRTRQSERRPYSLAIVYSKWLPVNSQCIIVSPETKARRSPSSSSTPPPPTNIVICTRICPVTLRVLYHSVSVKGGIIPRRSHNVRWTLSPGRVRRWENWSHALTSILVTNMPMDIKSRLSLF